MGWMTDDSERRERGRKKDGGHCKMSFKSIPPRKFFSVLELVVRWGPHLSRRRVWVCSGKVFLRHRHRTKQEFVRVRALTLLSPTSIESRAGESHDFPLLPSSVSCPTKTPFHSILMNECLILKQDCLNASRSIPRYTSL